MSPDMSAYEEQAWQRIQLWKGSKLVERSKLPQAVKKVIAKGKVAATAGWNHVPKHVEIEQALLAAVQGLHGLVADTAAHSVSSARIVKAYQDHGLEVGSLEDIRSLDLQQVDQVTPSLSYRYSVTLASEGAAAGLVAGGGTVVATAGGVAGAGAGAVPGVAATVGIFAADITALLIGSTRSVAHYAVYYGYDPREPGERAFMLGVLSASLLVGHSVKTAAFADLHKLVGLLARDAAWEVLGKDPLVKLSQKMFRRLGERLTKKKLGMAVPVAGAVIGSGLNYRYVRDVSDHAYWLYRERFLKDKYGLYDDVDLEPSAEIIDLDVLSEQDFEEPERDETGQAHGIGSKEEQAGRDWTAREIDVVIDEYADMLELQRQGVPFVKTQRLRAIAPELPARSRSSIERKYCNISACLDELGWEWIQGYKPLPHAQEALRVAVHRRFGGANDGN